MSANISRSAQPLRGERTAAAMGVWGLVLGLIVLLMFMAGLAAAALYLETGQPRAEVTGEQQDGWPPPHIAIPARHLAGIAVVVLLAGVAALSAAIRRIAAGAEQQATFLVTLGMLGCTTAVVLLVADLQATPFHWSDHAYTSIYWALTGSTALFVGVAAIMAGSVLVQLLVGVVDARRHLEVFATAVYGWFCVLAAVILLSLVHLLPLVAGSP
jgi:heme/copper-type cytochrome/quinol oxidase subunit 3